MAIDYSDRARHVLPGGTTHIARAYTPSIFVDRAQGSRKWLVDGRELIDYTMGHGALLLGHAHPAVVEAVQRQVARGTHFGAGHPLEIEWAERICRLVASVEEVRFTASGTEAAMLALRVSRAATGRQRILKLHDHFHGWYDAVMLDLDDDGRPRTAAGVPDAFAELTAVVRAGDLDALAAALRSGEIAAFIIELSGAHYGRVALDRQFIREAARLCAEHGTLLIADEVVTGFRVDPGGMQRLVGLTPDLSIFGKVMAGGLPGGAVGGRRDLMELLAREVIHPGTFNANPLTAAAGIATLDLAATGEPQRTATRAAEHLERGWREQLAAQGVDGSVWRLSSIVHMRVEGHGENEVAGALRDAGVDLLHTSAFCSSVHSRADVDATVAALAAALQSVAA